MILYCRVTELFFLFSYKAGSVRRAAEEMKSFRSGRQRGGNSEEENGEEGWEVRKGTTERVWIAPGLCDTVSLHEGI